MSVPIPRQRFTDLNHLALSLSLGDFQCEWLGWGFIGPRWWRNYLHTHSFFEVCYVFQGAGLFRSSNYDYPVGSGDLFVARPGDVHEIVSARDDPLGIYFWSFSVHARNTAAHSSGIDALLTSFLASSCLVSSRTSTMLRTLELLTEECVRREPGYRQAIEGLSTKLVLDTARAVVDVSCLTEDLPRPVRSPEETIVQTILRYLHDNYGRSITIRDLAAQVNLSERHTSRLFHKVMGVSIMEYLTTLRLKLATQLLLDRQAWLPIKEIAQACGYTDVRYFITLFRQSTGLTPGLFRQQGGTRFISANVTIEQNKHRSI